MPSIRHWIRRSLVVLVACSAALPAHAAQLYRWNAAAPGAWTNPANWSPPRNAPAATDILQIDANTTPTPTLTNVPSETIGSLLVQTGATVTLSTVAPVTVGLTSSNDALQVQTGASLRLSGANPISLSLAAGATTTVAGTIEVAGGAHRLLAADAGAIRFASGAAFTTNTGFAGNAFGASGAPGTVLFDGGSIYTHNAGANPFGLSAPNSKVTFATGSVAVWRTTAGFSSSGRTFADLRVENGIALSSTGSGDFTFDKLVVDAGCSFTHTGSGAQRVTVQDDLVNDGTALSIAPGTGGLDFSTPLVWTGDREHSVRGAGAGVTLSGAIHVASTSTLRVFNTPLTLAGASTALSVDGTLSMGETGAIAGPGSVAYSPGSLLELRPSSTGTYTVTDATLYWPATSGPPNVTCAEGATVDLDFLTRTIPASGVFTMAQVDDTAPVTLAHDLLIDGTLAKSTASRVNGTPTYGANATLRYTSGALHTPTGEWLANASAGAGVPANVAIDEPASLLLDAGALYVMLGNLQLTGNLDVQDFATLRVHGDWRQTNLTSTLTQRTDAWIEFAGARNSTLTLEDGYLPRTLSFVRMRLAKPAGSQVILSSAPVTNLQLWTSNEVALSMNDAGALWLNGNTLSLTGANAIVQFDNPLATGYRRINGPGTFAVYGALTTFVNLTTTHAQFDAACEVLLAAATDLGPEGANSTLISGTLHLQGAGSVVTHVADDQDAVVIYDGLGVRTRGLEWSMGSPSYRVRGVIVRGGTQFLPGGIAGVWPLEIDGDLHVETGSEFLFGNQQRDMVVTGDIAVDAGGTLDLSGIMPVHFEFRGNLTNLGTLADVAMTKLRVSGPGTQTLTSAPWNVDEFEMNKSGGQLVLACDLACTPLLSPPSAFTVLGAVSVLDIRGHELTLGHATTGFGGPGTPLTVQGDTLSAVLVDVDGDGGSLGFAPDHHDLGTLHFASLNPAGALHLLHSVDVWQHADFAAGVVTTGADTLRVHSGAALTRTSGWVNGTVQIPVAAGSPGGEIPLGTDTDYLPVTLALGGVTDGTDLLVRMTAGDHPALASSGLDVSRGLNRWWTLSPQDAFVFGACAVTCTFLPADLDAGVTADSLSARQYDAPQWSGDAITARTPTSVTVGGISHFSDFAFGIARSWIITSTATGSGVISPLGASAVIDGGSLGYLIAASPHHAIGDVVVDNVSIGAVAGYLFSNVHGDHTIGASFVLVNAAPVITGAHDLFGTVGVALVSGVTVTDADGDAVTCSGANLPAGATVSANGTFTWPSPVLGVYPNVTILADDGFGGHAQVSFTVTITAPVGVGDDARAVPATAGLTLLGGVTAGDRIACELAVPRAERATVRLYSARGRLVATLLDEAVAAGRYRLHTHQQIAAGVYLLRAEIGPVVLTRRVLTLE